MKRKLWLTYFILLILIKVHGQENDTTIAYSYLKEAQVSLDSSDFNNALIFSKKARKEYEKLTDSLLLKIADASQLEGLAYSYNGVYDSCIIAFKKALDIRRGILKPNHPKISDLQNNLGVNYGYMGELNKALNFHKESLQSRIDFFGPNNSKVGQSYLNIGYINYQKGNIKKAIIDFEKALSIWVEIYGEDHYMCANIYNNIGIIQHFLGDEINSINSLEKALEIRLKAKEFNNDMLLATTYQNLALPLQTLGDYEKAIPYMERSLILQIRAMKTENHPEIAATYTNLGSSYTQIGELDKALIYLEKALMIQKKLSPNHHHLAITIGSLAAIKHEQKNYEKAAEFYQDALEIILHITDSVHVDAVNILSNLSSCYIESGSYDKAYEMLILAKEMGDKIPYMEASDLINLEQNFAVLFLKKGEFEIANNHYHKALELLNDYVKNPSRFSIGNLTNKSIDLYTNIGKFEKEWYKFDPNINHLYSAHSAFKQALSILVTQHKFLSIKSKYLLSETTRSLFEGGLSTNFDLFQFTDSLKYIEESLALMEHSKAFILNQTIQESRALNYSGIPLNVVQKEYDLRIDISYYEKIRFQKLLEGFNETDTTVLNIGNKLLELEEEQEVLKKELEQSYPNYYELKYDLSTISLKEIQDDLLNPDQSMLSYFLGDSAIYILVINEENATLKKIENNFSVNETAKDMYYGLTHFFSSPEIPTDSFSILTNQYIEASNKLYINLIQPIEYLLHPNLVILRDGELEYIPFEALLIRKPDKIERFHTYDYLVKYHTISYNLSATLLNQIRNRKQEKAKINSVFAVAPFFYKDIDSVSIILEKENWPILSRNSLSPLEYSGEEVLVLGKIFGEKSNILLGKKVTSEVFRNFAPNYRFLHLSTHAKVDDRLGDFAYLAFNSKDSINEFEKLYVSDIYNIPLRAEMVVLSACETGIGELKRGEGIIGLTRAFTYSGAKSVFPTLWKVDDEETNYLMQKFYINLASNLTKDYSLHQAKIDYLEKNKGWDAHPFFWAAFIGIGDMEAIVN